MKRILFSLLIMCMSSAFATDLNVGCVTETPTTSMIAQTKNSIVTFLLVHHYGVKFMPIHNGVITPNDLGTLQDRASILADLGDRLEFTMPASTCQVDGLMFNCFGSQPTQTIGGHEVRIWAAYSSLIDEATMSGVYSYVTTNLAIEVDGQSYYLPMKYDQTECFKDFNKSKNLKMILKLI